MKKERIIKLAVSAAVLWTAFMLIFDGKEVASAAYRGVQLCLTVLIPSLFAFTVMSSLLVSSGIYKAIGVPLSPIARYVFRMHPEEFAVFLISQAAGYPVGAALISEMYQYGRITKQRASELLKFCIAPGPSFVLATAAVVKPELPRIYIAVFLSVLISNLIIAIICAIGKPVPQKDAGKLKITLSPKQFTDSVSKGAASMTVICSMVIFFCAVIAAIGKTGVFSALSLAIGKAAGVSTDIVYPIIRSIMEISNTTLLCGSDTFAVPVLAALLSFGGICVHLQIKAVCDDIPIFGSLMWRLPAAALAYFICRLLMPYCYTIQAAAVSAQIKPKYSDFSPTLSLILLIMTILLLSQKKVAKTKKI